MTCEATFTIVISNYNYARFLRDAIDSALSQTYPHVEVVVVDDGSTDDSREIIQSYGGKVIPVLKPNGGHASALNAGFAAGRGNIMIFLDSDDVLLPRTAERVAEIWRSDLAKARFWLDAIDENSRPCGPAWHGPDLLASEMRALLRVGPLLRIPACSGVAYPRSTLTELLPMNESNRMGADGYLQIAAPFLGEVATITECLGFYRIHATNNWSAGPGIDKLRRRLFENDMTLNAFRQFARKNGFSIGDDWLLRNPDYVSGRLESLRVQPTTHPYPRDRRLSLVLRGVRSSLTFPRARLRWRVFNALWLMFLGCAPRVAVHIACNLRHDLRQAALVGNPSLRVLRRLFGSAL